MSHSTSQHLKKGNGTNSFNTSSWDKLNIFHEKNLLSELLTKSCVTG